MKTLRSLFKHTRLLGKQGNNPVVLAGLLAALILVGYLLVSLSQGSNTTLYLVPPSGTVVQNNSFSVAIRLNTGGESVNAVQANLSYPADKLDFVSINDAGSAFGYIAENQGGDGSIRIARATTPGGPPASGDVLVSTVNFKAKVGSGIAAVDFAAGSGVARSNGDGVNILSGTTGGSYNFSPPPVTANPTPIPVTPKPVVTTPKPSAVTPKPVVVATPVPTAPPTATPDSSPAVAAPIASGPDVPPPAIPKTEASAAPGLQLQLGAYLQPLALGGLVLMLAGLVIFGIIRLEQSGAFNHTPVINGVSINEPPSPTTIYPDNYLPETPQVKPGQSLTLPPTQPGAWHTLPLNNAVMAAVVLLAVVAGVWVVHTGQAAIPSSTSPTPTPVCQLSNYTCP